MLLCWTFSALWRATEVGTTVEKIDRETAPLTQFMALVVLTENIRIGGFDKAHHLPNFKAWPERAKRGIDGNLWSRGTATMSYPFDACEEGLPCSVDVLPGRASAIHATRSDGIGRLGGASSKPLWQGAQHSRSSCSSRHVPWSTGKQDNKDGAGCSSCFTFQSTRSKTVEQARRVTLCDV